MLSSIYGADKKNVVIIHPRDNSGCSHVRLRWNANYFNAVEYGFSCLVSYNPIFDNSTLSSAKCIVCQRFCSENDLKIIKIYKELQPKYRYKLVFELDDQAWLIGGKEGVPRYNTSAESFNKDSEQIGKILELTLPWYDEIVVSTPYLKKAIEKDFNVYNVTVLKNVVPRYLWSFDRKKPITSDIARPKIGMTSSPCHYSDKDPGDLDNAFKDYIISAVKNKEIDFTVHSTLPFFWEEIKDCINVIPWCDCNTFPRIVMSQHYDFTIGPLVDNTFNKCKSELRFVEACAAGSVFIGTDFEDSPYRMIHPLCKCRTDITVEELRNKISILSQKTVYNEILEWQYDFINRNHYWLEDQNHINEWLKMVDCCQNQRII